MPIDTSVPQSDGWWLQQCWTKLDGRQNRLRLLADWVSGEPPLPPEMEQLRPALRMLVRLGRTNFAEMVVGAVRDRMRVIGIRTAADSDEGGDERAWLRWRQAGLRVESADVHDTMLALGDAYVIVGWDEAAGRPVVTSEDPRQVVTIHDPAQQRKVLAALKVFHDPVAQRDLAYLYMPGRVRVAFRSRATPVDGDRILVGFSGQTWNWSDEVDPQPLGGTLPSQFADDVVVVRFRNRKGIGEFERHLPLLERINHELLRRLVIMAFQAHRQRGVSGDLPETDDKGEEIDYDKVFEADPGAFWLLPPDAKIWESGQIDLTPILSSVKDDVLHLAAVTQTPMAMFTPDAATQSAEGASFQREGLSYRAEDRIDRSSDGWAQVMRLVFLHDPDDAARTDLDLIELMWAPVERHSLSEQASAWSQTPDLPFATRARRVLQAGPDEIARMQTERSDDAAFAAMIAPVLAAPALPTPVAP